MQPTVLHVFVSSTWLDLQPERAAVETALQRLRETKFVGMEYFGSRDEDTRRASLDEVDRSQVYVGIFGGRYGSGITEAEYRRARELGLPCFIYLKDKATIPPKGCEVDPEKAALLSALKAELLEHHTISTFTTPDDLAARVTADLHRWLFDEYLRPPAGIPFQAPAVPRYFVPRPEVSQALMDYLTADAPPGALVVSAVHGLGGIGKTTLVAALAHTPDVQARFPDGVLWATLGQEPDVLSLLAGWIQALGDRDFRPTVVESASAHLRTLLHDKACLLVVDDAWQADHTRAFLVGGERCRVLLTTRDAALARKVGARLYDLDVMTEAQALALFQARLGPLDGDREQAAALARELGYLPLALELAAAQVEAGLSWAELLDAFCQALADLAALDLDEATYRNESLRLSFCLSLEQLSPDDQDAFAWLGVLPEDARLNPTMAATLWDQPEVDARKRLRRLRDRALLKSVGDDRYTLHDLLHDEAKLRLAEQMPLPEAQVALLARYQQKVPDEQWHRLPDDGYVPEHLTWHVEQAEQPEAIHALLCQETREGRNAWYEARETLGQTAGYLDDVRRAWRLAEEQFAMGLQVRYALIVASLNSLAGNIPPVLLATLVMEGVWTPAQGLAYARQAVNEWQRTRALVALAPHLPPDLLLDTLALARTIKFENYRASVLAALAPHLPSECFPEALAVTRTFKNRYDRAYALAALAPHVPPELLPEALVTACTIEDGYAHVLTALVPHLSQAKCVAAMIKAIVAVRAIECESYRASALVALAPHLPPRLLPEALTVARTIEQVGNSARVLAALAPYLSPKLLAEALAAASTIGWAWARADALVALVPHLPLELLAEALAVARNMKDEEHRSRVLAALAPHLPLDLLADVLASACAIESGNYRGFALTTLAPHLSPELLAEALAAVNTSQPEGRCAEALDIARTIGWSRTRASALATLAPHLPQAERAAVLAEALAVTCAIQDADDRAEALAALAPYLPSELLTEALAAVRAIQDTYNRAKALAALAPYLPSELLAEALNIARAIGWTKFGTSAPIMLIPYLQQAERAAVLTEALTTIPAIRSTYNRVSALADLAPHLPSELLVEALNVARTVESGEYRVRALVSLIPHLHPELLSEALAEALAATYTIKWAHTRVKALTALAPHLPPAERVTAFTEALAAVHAIERTDHRAQALIALIPHLPPELLDEALAAARLIEDECHCTKALTALAPRLPQAERVTALAEALVAARAIERTDDRAQALTGLIPHLPPAERVAVLDEAMAAVYAIEWARTRGRALLALVSYLPPAKRATAFTEALAAARAIERADDRAQALTGLIPHLPPAERVAVLDEAMAAARISEDDFRRAWILATLAPHLAKRSPATLYPLWRETIRILAGRTRKYLLADISALAPVIAALGGEEAVVETFRAIQDVGRWWP